MKLIFNNGSGFNYPMATYHTDIGELEISYFKKISSNNERPLVHRFPIIVGLQTDATGVSVILSCALQNLTAPTVQLTQVSAVIPAQSGTTPSYGYAACSPSTKAISCGFERAPSTGSQDDLGCFIDIPNNRCVGWRDQDSGADPNLNVFCYCMSFL